MQRVLRAKERIQISTVLAISWPWRRRSSRKVIEETRSAPKQKQLERFSSRSEDTGVEKKRKASRKRNTVIVYLSRSLETFRWEKTGPSISLFSTPSPPPGVHSLESSVERDATYKTVTRESVYLARNNSSRYEFDLRETRCTRFSNRNVSLHVVGNTRACFVACDAISRRATQKSTANEIFLTKGERTIDDIVLSRVDGTVEKKKFDEPVRSETCAILFHSSTF